MKSVLTGLEIFPESGIIKSTSERLGLLANPASVDRDFRHAKDLINKSFPGQLSALFSPQHGFFAEKQDNMIESDHLIDSETGIPVFSLYHRERKPTKKMMDTIDTLIIDIQDVGTRVYTFIYTMSYCMEAAAEYGKRIIVLDRPNPVNGISVEGNVLNPEFASFVGRYPIPMRHGLTIGEMALMFNDHFNIGCDLKVVQMKNWHRSMYFHETTLPWILPSPNLPGVESSYVYPGQVIFEGTNISEGRGTTKPFELIGAPFINTDKLLDHIDPEHLKGLHLRPACFEPTSNKWHGDACIGFQLHITDINEYKPYITSLAFLRAFIATCGDDFKWKQPPYEYEFEKLPIDLIIGDCTLRRRIENIEPLKSLEKNWQEELDDYINLKQKYHLYT